MATPGGAPATGASDPIHTTTSNEKGTDGLRQTSDDVGFHLPNIPSWTRWALVSMLSFAIPLYKNMLRIEGEVEETAETLLEEAEKVSMVVQKVASEIADALPEDSVVEYDFVMIEHIAEEVKENTEKAEAFIQEVDEVKQKVENKLEPYVEKGEKIINGDGVVA